MKKTFIFLLIMFFTTIFMFSCKKEQPNPQTQEISFSLSEVNDLKDDFTCYDGTPDYVKVTIDQTEYVLDIFYINGVMLTQTLKFESGTYTISEFLVYEDNATYDTEDDDFIVYATPKNDSEFANFTSTALPLDFNVIEFQKTEIEIDVICFTPDQFENFGFSWFQPELIIIREEHFFGDICVKNPDDYENSLYASQINGLQHDMPAIFKIVVWRNDIVQDTFSNAGWLGEGSPLSITYGDYEGYTDDFEFKLYILVRKGLNFEFVYFYSWFTTDGNQLLQGDDNVVDFVLGNCVVDPDVKLEPYMNLPTTATYTPIGSPGNNVIQGLGIPGYIDAELSNIPSGYEIMNGTFGTFCLDHQTLIYMNISYNMYVYSSLYPEKMPQFAWNEKWEEANWIVNHLENYPNATFADLQGAFWLLDDPQWNGNAQGYMPNLNTLTYAQQMYDDAMLYGSGYSPPPGGWAAVAFIPTNYNPNSPYNEIQTVFMVVDP